MSWWPKPSVWRDGGLDVKYWTPNCEHWYQSRRAKILADDATKGRPLDRRQWKSALKFERKTTADILCASEDFAKDLLHAL